jgi:hypothetical protein
LLIISSSAVVLFFPVQKYLVRLSVAVFRIKGGSWVGLLRVKKAASRSLKRVNL